MNCEIFASIFSHEESGHIQRKFYYFYVCMEMGKVLHKVCKNWNEILKKQYIKSLDCKRSFISNKKYLERWHARKIRFFAKLIVQKPIFFNFTVCHIPQITAYVHHFII